LGSAFIVADNPARLNSANLANLSKNTTRFMPTTPKVNYAYWLRPNGTIASSRPSPLNGKRPQELIIMAETRRLLQLILHNKREETHPDLVTAIEVLLRSRLRRTSPLTELAPMQRIAWLDEYTHIECTAAFEGDSFAPGDSYRVVCTDIPTTHITDRQTMHGGTEEVLITGHELLVTVRDSRNRLHAFCHTGIPTDIEIHKLHHTQYLLNHFAIPDAPDITKVYPATYAKHRAFLSTL
jgi:hypothetical protein